MKTDIAGLKVDLITKRELLDACLKRVLGNQKTFVITPYSEFLYRSLQNPKLLDVFNSADFSVADGIGIFWAKRYLNIPFNNFTFIQSRMNVKYYLKILQGFWQLLYSLAAIVFWPSWIKSALPEKIVGADLVWDLAKLATANQMSIFLLGGFDDTAELAARKLQASDYQLQIAGWSGKNPDDPTVVDDINKVSPDMLFVAYGPASQEKWIAENLPNLKIRLAIGVGGTFDYLAEKKSTPPAFMRNMGLEWLWRLLTQSSRLKRITQATFGLMWGLWHYKVFNSLSLRPNVAIVILNKSNQILLCQRNPKDIYVDVTTNKETLKSQNYWQLPQGGIDGKEDVVAAAKREAQEETGIENLELLKVSKNTNTYFWNNALRGFWKNRSQTNSGQTQQIVYFRFSGYDNQIKVDQKEFISCQWVPLSTLEIIIHPERKALAKIIIGDLNNLIN